MIFWILWMFWENEGMLDNEYQWSRKLYPIIYPHCFVFVE